MMFASWIRTTTNRGEDGDGEDSSAVVRQEARRKSSVPALINAALGIEPVAAKIAPQGGGEQNTIDVQEFKRELERPGGIM